MDKTLVIHGRQPALGRAELEVVYGHGNIRPIGSNASLVNIEPERFDFMRFGGMVKFCKVLLELDTVNWTEIADFLYKAVPEHAKNLDDGRLTVGLSVYGVRTDIKTLHTTGIRLKKAIKKTGRSARIVPSKELSLSSAQVLHNKLTQKLGWELVFVRDGSKTILAQSIAVQDIEKYMARDQKRPFRDAKIGMLPPKLAQIIINLAVGPFDRELVCNTPVVPKSNQSKTAITILDPFCGSGVILQEASLMDLNAYGTDIDPKMVDYSQKNLIWLKSNFKYYNQEPRLKVADATSYEWSQPFDTVASETYLGKPLSTRPDTELLNKISKECDHIVEKFLKNLATQTKADFRLCLAVPAWKINKGFLHLKTLDKLSDLGYNRLKFVHTNNDELIYHRPDQIVARELVVLERK